MKLSNTLLIYKPIFKLKYTHLKQWLLLAALVVGNILQAASIVLINTTFSHFFGIMNLPVVTYQALVVSIAEFLGAVLLHCGLAMLNSYFTQALTLRVNDLLTHSFVGRWFESKMYYGRQFLNLDGPSNAATILSHDIYHFSKKTVSLFNNFINVFFNAVVGFYGLWQLSVPLQFMIGGLSWTFYGYMPIAAMAYAAGYMLCTHWLGDRFTQLTEQLKKQVDTNEAHLHHVEKNAEAVELLNAQDHEKSEFFARFKQSSIFKYALMKYDMLLNSFVTLNSQLNFFMGVVLNLPQIIAKTIEVDNVFVVANYFSNIVGMFTWYHDNLDNVADVDTLVAKLTNLQKEQKKWEEIEAQKAIDIHQGECFGVKNLQISKPNQEVLIQDEEKQFKPGRVMLIQSPSGRGKTTLGRTITQLWPYAKGEITLPATREHTHYIPQKAFFPLNATLYEAICYPKRIVEDKAHIDRLLTDFGLDVTDKETKKNWGTALSGGEQQRIELIRAILKKPQFLFMDEPFSALDKKTRHQCEKLLKQHLPAETKIMYIDHHETTRKRKGRSARFHDQAMTIDAKTKSLRAI